MLWWKVELDKSGAILTCEQVDSVSKGTKYVTYIQATTKAQACSGAKAWYEKFKAQNRAYNARARAKAKASGLCSRCRIKKPVTGMSSCQGCRDRVALWRKEMLSGDRAPRTQLTPEEVRCRKYTSRDRHRKTRGHFCCYSESLVKRATAMGDSGPLVQWLIAEQKRRAAEWAAASPEHADIAQAAE